MSWMVWLSTALLIFSSSSREVSTAISGSFGKGSLSDAFLSYSRKQTITVISIRLNAVIDMI